MEEEVRVLCKRELYTHVYLDNEYKKVYVLSKDNEYLLTLGKDSWGRDRIKFVGDDGVSREYTTWYRKYYFKDLKEKDL